MKWFYDTKIGIRLVAAFIVVGAITAVVGFTGIARLAKVAELSKASYEKDTIGLAYVKQANVDLIQVDRAVKNVLLASSPAEGAEGKSRVEASEKLVDADLENARPLIHTDKGKELLAQVDRGWSESRAVADRIVEMSLKEPWAKKQPSTVLSMGEGKAKSDAVEDSLSQLATNKEQFAKSSSEETEATYQNSRTLLLILVAAGVFAGLGLGIFIARSISTPLGRIAEIAKRLALGDIGQKVEYRSGDEVGSLAESFRAVLDALNALTQDGLMLSESAEQGKFDIRADATKHQGAYRQLIDGFNGTLDEVVEKVNWYQSIIDAVQFPIHVIDKDMKWVFLNKAFEKLMVDNHIIKSRADAPGMPCSSARANICKTDGCGLVQLSKGNGETYFDWNGQKCKQESSRLTSVKGEHIGFVEVVQDLTSIVAAKDYTNTEVVRLASNLVQIAKGDLAVNLKLADADKFTAEARAQFAKINDSLVAMVDAIKLQAVAAQKIAEGDLSVAINIRCEADVVNKSMHRIKESLQNLIADADMLATAARSGRVGARADASKHQGDYGRVIQGVNQILEAVVEPLRAAAENASSLASSSEELTAVSQQMAGNAEETAVQANVVSAASEQVSRNVASVATASEEMQASIREISKNANDSAKVAKNAVSVAASTNETMKKLGESSQEIGNVIKVITSIAQQTNLLALNATIEAARAGEAGKGFAVVANEVKELAKQTAKATEEISQKIEAIQDVTKGAVSAIEEISGIINQINDISNSIASAVEEQTVTTNEIGRSVTEAAQGVNDIAKNIGGVATAAKNTTQGANDTKTASLELSEMASRLQSVVSKFTF